MLLRTYIRFLLMLVVLLALTPVAQANIVGTGTQNFFTTANAYDYVTVHSSRTIGQGNFHLNLFLNAAVNTVPYFDESESEYIESSRSVYNDSITSLEGSIGYGLMDNWDIGLNIPSVVYQDISADDEPHGEYSRRGVTEFRVSTKVGLIQQSMFGLAAIGSVNLNAIEDNPYSGKDSGPAMNAELAGDVKLGNVELASNIGYRVLNNGDRLEEDTPVEPHSNQFIASAALAYYFSPWDTKWITEVFSSSPTSSLDDDSDRHTTRAEAITGIKIYYLENLFYHFGMGTELRHSVASADWRGYGGINYILGSNPDRIVKKEPKRDYLSKSTPTRQPDQVIVVRDIHFEFDSAEMTDRAKSNRVIDKLAEGLKKGSLQKVVIEGHTCSLGTNEYNRKLSQRRANAIRSILISRHGFPSYKIKAIGLGESMPVATNKTDAGRRLNRRVEFKIYRDLAAE